MVRTKTKEHFWRIGSKTTYEKIHFFTLFIKDLCQLKLFVKPKMNSPGQLSLEGTKNSLYFEVFFSIVATRFL